MLLSLPLAHDTRSTVQARFADGPKDGGAFATGKPCVKNRITSKIASESIVMLKAELSILLRQAFIFNDLAVAVERHLGRISQCPLQIFHCLEVVQHWKCVAQVFRVDGLKPVLDLGFKAPQLRLARPLDEYMAMK
jgi:hypothetical protein